MSPRLVLAAVLLAVAVPALTALPPFAHAAPPPAAPANAITFTGKLSTGIMAIGGETTGTIISDGKTSYELDVKDAALKTKVRDLAGKQVTVKGTLTVKAGVEIAQRRIITVDSLEPAAATTSAPATASAPAPQPK